MIDIKFLRENPEIVKENIRRKFQDAKIYPLYAQQDRDASAFHPTDQMFYLVEKEERTPKTGSFPLLRLGRSYRFFS